ncbi:hypothetical protein L1987_36709 [Smallanthus sonchifolius]|uniref:Uncharacterized protein n=1 Tax=Smallanthus sonchifolius TaxID=185202 RepID=A0ACB9HE66_9ASTR|nr:hypothetical protein L1987_36709 [Smallanthus sonchifolius]
MEVGKEVTKCGVGFGVGVVVVMEVTQVGVRTRDRAMAMMTEETADNSGAVKRRKLSNEKLRSPSSTFVEVETKTIDCEKRNDCCDAAASSRSGGVPACCCSSTGAMEILKGSDLEEIVETGTPARHNLDGNESTPRGEFNAEPGELESTAMKQYAVATSGSCRTVLPAEKMPPEAELEEFFAAAQEGLNERFKNKYNYDIVNDIPLKGRFEWIQLKPRK